MNETPLLSLIVVACLGYTGPLRFNLLFTFDEVVVHRCYVNAVTNTLQKIVARLYKHFKSNEWKIKCRMILTVQSRRRE